MHYIHVAEAWLASNILVLLAGGYLGYRWGSKVEALVARVLGLIRKV